MVIKYGYLIMFYIYIMDMDSICLYKILLFYDVNGVLFGLMLWSKVIIVYKGKYK